MYTFFWCRTETLEIVSATEERPTALEWFRTYRRENYDYSQKCIPKFEMTWQWLQKFLINYSVACSKNVNYIVHMKCHTYCGCEHLLGIIILENLAHQPTDLLLILLMLLLLAIYFHQHIFWLFLPTLFTFSIQNRFADEQGFVV